MSEPIDEGLARALVNLAGRALRSPSVRQTARTAALAAGAGAAWRSRYGGNREGGATPRGGNTNPTPPSNDTWSRMVSTESGGRQFGPGGQTLTSHRGAIGAAQIMPQYGQEFARRAGVEWDERRARTDRDYNLRLGRAQFDHLLNTYKGDHARAAAAYNAGPTGLARAERRARAAGRPDSWREYLPAETRDYVGKVVREDTDRRYLSKTDIINNAIGKYATESLEEVVTLEEAFVKTIEQLPEAHAITLLRLFKDLAEDNQETMYQMVQTAEGVRDLLDFAIDKYMAQKN